MSAVNDYLRSENTTLAVPKTGRGRVRLEQKGWKPGSTIRRVLRDKAPNEKELRFYANLLEFLREKGADVTCFEKSKNRQTMWSRINGMKTVLVKHEWDTEFFNRYYGGKEE